MMKNILIACLILMALPAVGQKYQQEYLQGKEFLNSGRYALAMESFKPLVSPVNDSPLSKYAMYFYAVAAYKDGYPALAKNMFLQVQELFPQWEQQDEVNLWLAKLYLENKSYNQALNALDKIKTNELREEKENLFEAYISEIEDIFFIRELHEQNPENKPVAKRYAELISQESLQDRDQQKLMQLIYDFRLDAERLGTSVIKKSPKKDSYRVGVLLPFVHESLEMDIRPKRNQFVLDMYNGIRMAVDTLKDMGINIELFAYDTRREYNTTKEILNREELKSMDLLIGPLYPEPLQLAQDFAYRNKINLINPLSNNPAVLGNNPFSYLFKPSYATIGEALGDYSRKEIENPYGIILYGETEADSIMAASYRQAFEAEGKNKIVLMERISSSNPRRVLDILTSAGKKLKETGDPEGNVKLTIPADSVGSLYVASDDNTIITRVLSGIETRGDSITILGSDKWLDINSIDYSALERLGVVIAAPTFLNFKSPWFEKFRRAYINQYRELPSDYAVIGFDLMMFAGTALNEHGKYFQLGLQDQKPVEGFLFSGYNYRSGNDNKVVPIVKVIFSEPQIVEVKNYATDQPK